MRQTTYTVKKFHKNILLQVVKQKVDTRQSLTQVSYSMWKVEYSNIHSAHAVHVFSVLCAVNSGQSSCHRAWRVSYVYIRKHSCTCTLSTLHMQVCTLLLPNKSVSRLKNASWQTTFSNISHFMSDRAQRGSRRHVRSMTSESCVVLPDAILLFVIVFACSHKLDLFCCERNRSFAGLGYYLPG